MLFSKTSAGIEISTAGVKCVLVGGSLASPRLERVAQTVFPENTIHISLREQNVLNPEVFVDRVRAAHNLLLSRSERVALTLPDSVGRMLLLDFEGRFKSRNEALDLIRWKLKKSIPFEVADTHLDFQQLAVRENGDLALLVALVSRSVVSQYEELLVKAGLSPFRIDFNTFNVCRFFERSLSGSENCFLISFFNGTLSIVAFTDGIPEFLRIKEISDSATIDSRLFMEINSSLLVYRERFPEQSTKKCFCLASPQMMPTVIELVTDITGTAPTALDTKSELTPGNSAPADQATLFAYTAAIGAALRGL